MSESPNLFPTLRYVDADAAIAFLTAAFGFSEHAVHRGENGRVQHAQLRLGAGMIMLGEFAPGGIWGDTPPDASAAAQSVYAVVEDPDAHHARAVAAGADIVLELTDQDYGSREYSARDLEGNRWSFGTYDPYAGGE